MNYKKLETMRQTRLMVTEVIVPTVCLVAGAINAYEKVHPGDIRNRYEKAKEKFTNLFEKKNK